MALTAQRKQTIHHKKARGEHHTRSKHYLKAYHPYLPLLMLVVVGLAVNALWTSHGKVLGASTNMSSYQLLQDTNTERKAGQEPDLKLNNQLSAAAQSKANDMVQHNYWSHNSPDGKTPWSFIHANGYQYQSAGENLAYGFSSADSTITGWMNSPEHRANILSADYSEVGFGMATTKNYLGKGPATVVVAMYGAPTTDNVSLSFDVPTATSSTATNLPYKNVSRIQMLFGNFAPWSFTLMTIVTLLAVLALVYRHAVAWHRLLVQGESFILRHKVLDVTIIAVAVAGVVLTRAAGFIG